MKVLVCGAREWDDDEIIHYLLSGIAWEYAPRPTLVIHGAARGADSIAGKWARQYADRDVYHDDDTPGFVNYEEYPANWEAYGRAAGVVRNQQMLDEGKPDMVLAFHNDLAGGSRGTRDMVERAVRQGVPTYEVRRRA